MTETDNGRSTLTQPVPVLVPPLGQTVDTVILTTWYKREGEAITQGEPLFAIETDKATLDVEAPASGYLQQVSAQEGEEVKVLSAIAGIALAPSTALTPESSYARSPSPNSRKEEMQTPIPYPLKTGGAVPKRQFVSPRARKLAEREGVSLKGILGTGPEGAIIERDVRQILAKPAAPAITPLARRMAEEAGLEWQKLPGSGLHGRVMRKDIELAVPVSISPETVQPAPSTADLLETIPIQGVRAVIAERMAASHSQTAPVTLTSEVDATALVELRRELAKDGIEVSYNDLLIHVLRRALQEMPRLNATLSEDGIQVWRSVHIGLAVDTERGLLVPVIRNVEKKGLEQIAHETKELAERARLGLCQPEELQGSTFTLTNLGMYAIDAFTPIINTPECAILGVGRIKTRPVMVDQTVVGRQMVWLSLTFDHRLVDGGPAARFLQRVGQLVERPHLLIT